ncbi:MAG: methylenetetrahydrofolate reductase [NAD(P)H] [Vicinamibacteria bacterium]|jgi:methylenetetrahydrofolate reductase (NADPH)|nr:methylenetetrahydrofolate reductase [NAD(P)H] [Vicinamibacteria bacterium]
MHINDIFARHSILFSFEFSPPKDQAASDDLFRTISDLIPLQPAYVSVTYGAGGSTRQLTRDLILRIQQQTNLTVVSHLTCVGATQDEIRHLLEDYHASGVRNIMALRGDPPRGQSDFQAVPGGFAHATELVAFIKKHFPDMGIGVAGYPEGHPGTPNRMRELEFLKQKVDAGADYVCTQLFFDNRDFYDFCERCELAGIQVPILAGIMPITSRKTMTRMADLALGSRYPARLLRALARAEDDQYFEKVGLHWATEQTRDLLDHGVRGIHFYTLNRSKATLRIYDSLGVSSSAGLMR